jgi:hypothetical protein
MKQCPYPLTDIEEMRILHGNTVRIIKKAPTVENIERQQTDNKIQHEHRYIMPDNTAETARFNIVVLHTNNMIFETAICQPLIGSCTLISKTKRTVSII